MKITIELSRYLSNNELEKIVDTKKPRKISV